MHSTFFGFAADHPKSDEYFSDPRLAAYAVPYRQVIAGYACVVPVKLLISVVGTQTITFVDVQAGMIQGKFTCGKKLRY